MTDYNLTKGGSVGYPDNAARKCYVVEAVFDATEQALAQNDVAQLINVPANTYVERVFWEVTRVEGGSRNFALGDGATTNGYIASTTANSLAKGVNLLALTEAQPNTVTGYSHGKFYPSADTIDLLAVTSGGLTGCRIVVRAQLFDLN